MALAPAGIPFLCVARWGVFPGLGVGAWVSELGGGSGWLGGPIPGVASVIRTIIFGFVGAD
jgi:hypothetical protein